MAIGDEGNVKWVDVSFRRAALFPLIDHRLRLFLPVPDSSNSLPQQLYPHGNPVA